MTYRPTSILPLLMTLLLSIGFVGISSGITTESIRVDGSGPKGIDSPGTIGGNDSFCEGTQPSFIQSLQAPSSETNDFIEIRWERRTPSGSWSVIPEATMLFYVPGVLTETMLFRRGCRASSDAPWIYSNSITKTKLDRIEEVSATQVNVRCKGEFSGEIDLMITGGEAPYTYEWSNGETTNFNENLSAGTYTVIVTDQNGCVSDEQTFVIREPEDGLIAYPAFAEEPSCAGSNDGFILADALNGTPPYTYNWSNGATEDINMNLTAGSYSVVVRDQNNCTFVMTDIILEEPEPIQVNNGNKNISCKGMQDGRIALAVNGGTAPYNYTWSDGGFNPEREDLEAGDYEVTIEDVRGCSSTEIITIVEPDTLGLTEVIVNNTICYGSINLIPNGGTAPYEFEWENGENTSFQKNLCPGDYAAVVTDSNGCRFKKTMTLSADFEDNEISVEISVNPFHETGIVHISVPYNEPTDITIYNSIGQVIEKNIAIMPDDNNDIYFSLDLTKYNAGVYLFSAICSGEQSSEKLVISR